MKRILGLMIVLPLAVLVCMTGCTDDDFTPVTSEPEPEEPVVLY